jgi:hypothetical protein
LLLTNTLFLPRLPILGKYLPAQFLLSTRLPHLSDYKKQQLGVEKDRFQKPLTKISILDLKIRGAGVAVKYASWPVNLFIEICHVGYFKKLQILRCFWQRKPSLVIHAPIRSLTKILY